MTTATAETQPKIVPQPTASPPAIVDIQTMLNALDFEFPVFIHKLMKEHVVDSYEEGEVLFQELKRFLVLIRADTQWDMYSRRVDEAWHQFVLFTTEYTDFCITYFGEYVHHKPGIMMELEQEQSFSLAYDAAAPQNAGPGNNPQASLHMDHADHHALYHHDHMHSFVPSTFLGFQQSYTAFYGEPLPMIWSDFQSIETHRRMINDSAGKMFVRDSKEEGQVELVDADQNILISVNELAREALVFIANTKGFYVRELPGNLTGEEQIGLVTVLAQCQGLRVAP